jgi:hypothetical protein
MIKAFAKIGIVFTLLLLSNNLAGEKVGFDGPGPMCIPPINCGSH